MRLDVRVADNILIGPDTDFSKEYFAIRTKRLTARRAGGDTSLDPGSNVMAPSISFVFISCFRRQCMSISHDYFSIPVSLIHDRAVRHSSLQESKSQAKLDSAHAGQAKQAIEGVGT